MNIAYGFLAGKEVKAAHAGNVGLQDRELCVPRILTNLILVIIKHRTGSIALGANVH